MPVLYAISSNEKTAVVEKTLNALKERVGLIEADIFMSDDSHNFRNAWSCISMLDLHKVNGFFMHKTYFYSFPSFILLINKLKTNHKESSQLLLQFTIAHLTSSARPICCHISSRSC